MKLTSALILQALTLTPSPEQAAALEAVVAQADEIPETITLREWDFETGQAGAYVDREYPAALLAKFVNWLRETKAWWEDVDLVHRKVVRLNQDLAEHRQREKERVLVLLAAETALVKGDLQLVAQKKARQLEAAARGRATAAANRAAKKAAAGGS